MEIDAEERLKIEKEFNEKNKSNGFLPKNTTGWCMMTASLVACCVAMGLLYLREKDDPSYYQDNTQIIGIYMNMIFCLIWPFFLENMVKDQKMDKAIGSLAFIYPIIIGTIDVIAVAHTSPSQNFSDFGGKGTNNNYLSFLFAVAGIWGALGASRERNRPLCYAAAFLLTSFVPFNVTNDRQNYIIRFTQRTALSYAIGLLLTSLSFHLA